MGLFRNQSSLSLLHLRQTPTDEASKKGPIIGIIAQPPGTPTYKK